MARRHGRAASRGAGERLRSSVLRGPGQRPPVATGTVLRAGSGSNPHRRALHVGADLGGGVPIDGYTLIAPSWTVTYEQRNSRGRKRVCSLILPHLR